MEHDNLQGRWSKPFCWLTGSFLAAFFLQFELFTPQYMVLAVGSLVFLENEQPSFKLIFLIGFLCDVTFHRPFGFYNLIFLALIWLSARFRYRFFLANPILQSISVMIVLVSIEFYEMLVFHWVHRAFSWDYFVGTCLSSGLLWPVYARLLAVFYGRPVHRTVIG